MELPREFIEWMDTKYGLQKSPNDWTYHTIPDVCQLSLLMKWLRDEKGIYIYVEPYSRTEFHSEIWDSQNLKNISSVAATHDEAVERVMKRLLDKTEQLTNFAAWVS